MKKYEKPALYAETFILVEHIADRCALDYTPETHMRNGTPNHGNSSQCSFVINGGAVFLFNNDTLSQDCQIDISSGVDIECYNNFSDANNLFSS